MKIKIVTGKKEDRKNLRISYSSARKMTDSLEQSTEFEKQVFALRRNWSVPKSGFLEGSKEFDTFISNKWQVSEFHDDVIKLCAPLDLPNYWWLPISYFVLCNVLYLPEKETLEICSVDEKSGISAEDIAKRTETIGRNKEVVVILSERFSKQALHDKIDSMWSEIETHLLKIPCPPTHSMQRSKLAKKIAILRDEKKMRFSEIVKELSKEYENDLEIYEMLTDSYARQLYKRWKDRTKGIRDYFNKQLAKTKIIYNIPF